MRIFFIEQISWIDTVTKKHRVLIVWVFVSYFPQCTSHESSCRVTWARCWYSTNKIFTIFFYSHRVTRRRKIWCLCLNFALAICCILLILSLITHQNYRDIIVPFKYFPIQMPTYFIIRYDKTQHSVHNDIFVTIDDWLWIFAFITTCHNAIILWHWVSKSPVNFFWYRLLRHY